MDGWQETKLICEGGRTYAVTSQNVNATLEDNKRNQAINPKGDWGKPIAEIPNVIVNQWCYEQWARGNRSFKPYGPEWKALVRRKLRDPDWRWLRLDNPSNPFFVGWRR